MKKKEPINWAQVAKTFIIIFCISSVLSGGVFYTYKSIKKTAITGTIISKYKSGPNNNVNHFIISDGKTNIDLEASDAIYNSYDLNDVVFADYNLLRNIQYIQKEDSKNGNKDE